MERFCHTCGTLVTGEGAFCPQCGGNLDEIKGVNLEKPVEQTVPAADAAPVVYTAPAMDNTAASANTTYGGATQDPHTATYVNPTNAVVTTPENTPMTLGQWVGTILLTSCLGLVSIVLLFVWSFSDTPEPKKTYCRGMLIVQGIFFALSLIWIIICFAFAFSVPAFFLGLSELG